MEEIIKEFWEIYDKYIQTEEKDLRPRLSEILAQIENKDRRTQLLRLEKGWDRIVGWQVIRSQVFHYTNSHSYLNEGEILIWEPHWDRDIFLTRIPMNEVVSGGIIRPGYNFGYENKGNMSDYDYDQVVKFQGMTDERGLYLPLYDIETLKKLALRQFEIAKEEMIKKINHI